MSDSLHTPDRPNDEIRFGDGEEPDWDRFLESHFYVSLLDGGDGGPPAPLIKSNPRINDGEPYFVLSSGLRDQAQGAGELSETYVSGRQALSLTPPGVSILVDDFSLRATSDQIAYLRAEIQRLGDPNLVLEDLMIRFGFTAEDLEANRAGNLSTRQRNRLLEQPGHTSDLGVGACVAIAAAALSFGATVNSSPITQLLVAAVTFVVAFALFFGHWWYQHRFPLGENRVQVLVAETNQSKHPTKTKMLSQVGRGLGSRWLPVAIPEGMLVRLYWNAGAGNETLVHSIEPARVGDLDNDRPRNRLTFALLTILTVALFAFGLYLRRNGLQIPTWLVELDQQGP